MQSPFLLHCEEWFMELFSEAVWLLELNGSGTSMALTSMLFVHYLLLVYAVMARCCWRVAVPVVVLGCDQVGAGVPGRLSDSVALLLF
ncbi:hypothetical protein Nepgr_028931 [Nepenthes gracilis]|uniref:Uncharacterized protein n=1 Tax=Nepenthes gracilis TaxID=150966 RepID=A0AAD3Y2U7_NEPGR|nr:hypothetical protein Nepgr_028931 [Nepenthes gracilis]